MRGKNVILMTVLFMMTVLACGTAYGQAGPFLLGSHSPALAYSPQTQMYRSVFQMYQSYFLQGMCINQWGTTTGGCGLGLNTIGDDHAKPAIAYDSANDRFLMAWTGLWPESNLNGLFGDSWDENPFIISNASGAQAYPVVTYDSVNARYLVTWIDYRTSGQAALYGQLVNTDGAPQGIEFLIDNEFGGQDSRLSYSVAYDNVNQRFLVVSSKLLGQLINANGVLDGEKFIIMEDNGFFIGHTSLTYDGLNQRYLMVWDLGQGGGSTFGQLLNTDGTRYGRVFSILNRNNPTVAFDHVNERFLVAATWGGTYGQFVNPDGTLQGGEIAISQSSYYYYDDYPAIAFNPECGNFLVASVSRNESTIKGLWAMESDINYNIVGEPCPAANLTVKKKGYHAARSHIGSNNANSGTNCVKKKCTAKYLLGDTVSLTAYPEDSRTTFDSWMGCDMVDGNVCYVIMDSDKSITATFVKPPKRLR